MRTKVSLDRLLSMTAPEKFRGFEQEVESAIARELDERRRKAEEAKRAREKKAKKKRLKAAASSS